MGFLPEQQPTASSGSPESDSLSRLIGKFLDQMQLRNKLSFVLGDNQAIKRALGTGGQPAVLQNNNKAALMDPVNNQKSSSRYLAHMIEQDAVQIISLFQETFSEQYNLLQNAVDRMHSSPQQVKNWHKLCQKHNKDLELLPKDVKTQLGLFDQLLMDAVRLKDVLKEFVTTTLNELLQRFFWTSVYNSDII